MNDESLFAAALSIPNPAERAAYLDRACAGNPKLRREVDDLLSAHALVNPLEGPPTDLGQTGAYDPDLAVDPMPVSIGERIGPYRLMEQIGEGGFGLVYVAEQSEPVRRKVALKVLKPGMDTRDVVGRFEAERQALALMDHPNIAKVFDAGSTPQGRPYFVMELVRGEPITDYCDRHKLSPWDRLALFVLVCQAVQHAHQKGIIHRDIKPRNVLVTMIDGKAVPKVIDFGVAKAVGQSLTDKTVYTKFAQFLGTPLYMSPEQAEFSGVDVDTRADIYALGVLLYELLTGTTPFDRDRFKQAAFDEIRRIIRVEEPPKPSTRLSSLGDTLSSVSASRNTEPARLAGLVRGELDWIVMKCLEKDRNRRYEAANGLAKDVQRYLDGDTVEACPPTLGYRLRKAYRRNRAKVLAAGLIGLALLTGLVAMSFGFYRADLQRLRAEGAEVSAVQNALVAMDAAEAEKLAKRDAQAKAAEASDALGKLRIVQEKQTADQYVWDMQMLPLAFRASNAAGVNQILDRHLPAAGQPDRRRFEWHYWNRQLHQDLRTSRLEDKETRPGSWAASPDGTRVARLTIPGWANKEGAREESAVLTVWDIATRKVVLTHKMPPRKPEEAVGTSSVYNPLFSPDGRRVLACWAVALIVSDGKGPGATPRHRQVIDVATGKVLVQIDGNDQPFARLRVGHHAAFSPDSRRFAAVSGDPSGDSRVQVWNLETGKEIVNPLLADDLAEDPFSPDGTRLVTTQGGLPKRKKAPRVSVWDLSKSMEAVGWDLPDGIFRGLAASPDGKQVAGVIGDQPAVSSDARLRSDPRLLRIWDAASGKDLHTLPMVGPSGGVNSNVRMFFSPDGSKLAVERHHAEMRTTGMMTSDFTIWDAVGGKPLPMPEGLVDHSIVRGLSGPTFSPDGKQILSTDGPVIRTWDTETGKPVLVLHGHAAAIGVRSFSSDGTRLWSLDSNDVLKEWNAQPNGRVKIPVDAAPEFGGTAAYAFAVSPDGNRVAAMVEDRKDAKALQKTPAFKVWDATGQTVKVIDADLPKIDAKFRNSMPIYAMALSHDGRRAVLIHGDIGRSSFNPTNLRPIDLIAWDVDSGKVLLKHSMESRARPNVAISPDGQLAAVAVRAEGEAAPVTVRIVDLNGGPERKPFKLPNAAGVAGVSLSPDGQRIAMLILHDDRRTAGGTLVIRNLNDGTITSTLEVPSSVRLIGEFGSRFAWSPDGKRFAFSRDPQNGARIEIHDAATGRSLVKLDDPVGEDLGASLVPTIAWSPDGTRVAAYLPPQSVFGPRVVKVWDAAGGKTVLTFRMTAFGPAQGTKRLTFNGDGHRLIFTEVVTDAAGQRGGIEAVTRSIVLNTWVATPVVDRGVKGP